MPPLLLFIIGNLGKQGQLSQTSDASSLLFQECGW